MRDLAQRLGGRVLETVGRAAGRVQENRPLPADLLESDDAYLAVFDAPGASASDVDVRYVDDRVEVTVDRFRDRRSDYDTVLPGRGLSLSGRVTLPTDAIVDPATASATLTDDGTLQVRVPKVGSDAGERIDEDESDEETGAGIA